MHTLRATSKADSETSEGDGDTSRPTINMEIPTAKYGKTTKNMEKIHVRMRVKIQ